MLNTYYDRVVPTVEQSGGGVLKILGDAVLAVFDYSGHATNFDQVCNTTFRGGAPSLEWDQAL
jgi:class 3 adenylate cyclase